MATASTTADAVDWTASEPITGTVRLLDRERHDGPALADRHGSPAGRRPGRARDPGGAVVADGRYRLRVDGVDRAGNPVAREATVLVDRTIRSAAWTVGSVRAARRADRRRPVPA